MGRPSNASKLAAAEAAAAPTEVAPTETPIVEHAADVAASEPTPEVATTESAEIDVAYGDKISVATSGTFMFQDPTTLEVVEADGTSTVTYTHFIQSAIIGGVLVEA